MIDWDRVMELREEVGADAFLEVAEMFLAEVEESLGRLGGAVNISSLEDDLHFLKGSALNLGFSVFADLCREGEHKAAAADFASIDLASVGNCFAASKEAFIAGLAQRMAS